MTESFFHSLMNPKSIAIVGASNNPMKMGTMHALSILKDGYKGKFYPVHPIEKTVLGHPAFKSPLDLPEAPDLAMLVIPSQHLLPVFEAFGKIGTKYAIVITAGFNEAGAKGAILEEQLKALAKKYGIRFVGPNCMGIVNRAISLNTSVSPIVGKPGKLGLISQSGTYVAQTVDYLKKRGIRLSKAVSVGNEADINIIDVLAYFGEDNQTSAISMYIESIRDVKRFLDVARKITPHKPIIAQYIGGSDAGGRAGLSHTGAMAGKDYLYDGLFKQAGIIRVYSVEDLYGIGWAFATQPKIKGNRIAIITNSGGPGSAIADTCDANGCEMPPFSEELQKTIKPLIPSHAPCGNPVDLTFALDMKVMTHTIPDLVMKSGEVDGIVLHGAMSTGFLAAVFPHLSELMPGVTLEDMIKGSTKDLTDSVQVPFKNNIPMTVSSFFDRADQYTQEYEDNDIPVFDSPEKAAHAISALVKYKTICDRKSYQPPLELKTNDTAMQILKQAIENNQSALDEYSAKQLLASYGIPIPNEILCHNADETIAAGKKIGFPVVAKACDPSIMHKTDSGLVHLNISDSKSLVNAYHAIQKSTGRPVPVLVGKMIKGQREFLAGITFDEQFGHCVAFGVGGIFTEALNDVSYRVAPLSDSESEEMLNDIRSSKLLFAYRGMLAVNVKSLAGVLSILSKLPLLHDQIKEIDINPIIISDAEPVVVDALIVLK
ncbi:MAG: acetate--CoA ligase family protein [Desulfobacteraceae bacterium]|nr:acetate--CoA ligase family protein [Desulfobacteraceae bacterium]